MPVLEITTESLAPNRAPLTCSYILAVMLWPDDEPARRKWMETQTTQFMAESLFGNRQAEAAAHRSLFDMALRATPPQELSEEARPLCEDGLIVGETLMGAVEGFARDGRVSLDAIRMMQTAPERRTAHPSLDRSPQRLSRDWGYFRRVMHLWAATVHANVIGYDTGLPCSPSRLVEFLAIARGVELVGGRCMQSNRRREKVLDAASLWTVPSRIHPYIAAIDDRADLMLR